jgi:hypothetical protein
MTKKRNKSYLEISKQARAIIKANVPVDVQKIKEQITETKNIRSKKEALAVSAFWLAVARSLGENIPMELIEERFNKLKGKNNSSSLAIRQELNRTIKTIDNQQIKSILSGMDQKKLVTAVAETVVQSMGSQNTIKEITKQDEEHGWTKFIIALAVVLVAKFASRKG